MLKKRFDGLINFENVNFNSLIIQNITVPNTVFEGEKVNEEKLDMYKSKLNKLIKAYENEATNDLFANLIWDIPHNFQSKLVGNEEISITSSIAVLVFMERVKR